MKTLTLLRHAKSTWDDPVARDFDRPLNRRGRKAAHAVGRAMENGGLRFDRVIASPAARVTETIDGLADGYSGSLEPIYDQRVYLASPATLLEVIHEVPDTIETLLIVGHNPGLEMLALLLAADDGDTLRAELAVKYPTAALAEIRLPVTHWRDVTAGMGKVTRFVRPRDLDPELGPDQDTH